MTPIDCGERPHSSAAPTKCAHSCASVALWTMSRELSRDSRAGTASVSRKATGREGESARESQQSAPAGPQAIIGEWAVSVGSNWKGGRGNGENGGERMIEIERSGRESRGADRQRQKADKQRKRQQ